MPPASSGGSAPSLASSFAIAVPRKRGSAARFMWAELCRTADGKDPLAIPKAGLTVCGGAKPSLCEGDWDARTVGIDALGACCHPPYSRFVLAMHKSMPRSGRAAALRTRQMMRQWGQSLSSPAAGTMRSCCVPPKSLCLARRRSAASGPSRLSACHSRPGPPWTTKPVLHLRWTCANHRRQGFLQRPV